VDKLLGKIEGIGVGVEWVVGRNSPLEVVKENIVARMK